MKIRLVNFLCYSDNTFDFGDGGLALLSGPSGSGKTSIMRGINFALFGEGTKLATYGKKSCTVELEFCDLRIVRTKVPNTLTVNDYKGDVAQDIIYKKFGNTFKTSGYIQQNNLNSFILMSPLEKLGFLEKFAFKDVNLGAIKAKCKNLISTRNDKLIESISQLQMAEDVLSNMSKPEVVEFPIKCLIKQREKVTKNETTRHKNTLVLIKRARKAIKELQTEINDIKVLNTNTSNKQEALTSIGKKINELSVQEEEIKYEGDDALTSYKNLLKSILSRRELTTLENSYNENVKKLNEMKEQEERDIVKEIDDCRKSLWNEHSQEECTETINDCRKCIVDMELLEKSLSELKKYGNIDGEKIEQNKSDLEEYRLELDEKRQLYDCIQKQKELLSCPSCHVKLRFKKKDLYLADENGVVDDDVNEKEVVTRINELKSLISKLEVLIPEEQSKCERKRALEEKIQLITSEYDDVPELQSLREDLEYMLEYQRSQQDISNRIKKLEKRLCEKSFSSSFTSFQKSVSKQLTELTRLKMSKVVFDETTEEFDEEELRNTIHQQETNKDKLRDINNRKTILLNEKETYEQQLIDCKEEHIDKHSEIRDQEILQNLLDEEEAKIPTLENQANQHQQNLENIEKFNRYKEQLNNYQEWQKKVTELRVQEKIDRDSYASATMLKEKILEAESIAMLNIISSINIHAQLYLDCFFTENPIIARLCPFKETKKSKKPQINIEIEYKGMEADTTMLSGGELSRVVLAYTLALGEMFNTPLLLLDECTSSLDQDLTSTVFNAIREHFNGKQVLIVAHQVVTGIFDNSIKLGDA